MLENIEEEYKELVKKKCITADKNVISGLKWKKANNDFILANHLFELSDNPAIRKKLNMGEVSFFDWVIVVSYYAIFHSAQALMATKQIKIRNRVHYSTLVGFAKHFVINNELDERLFLFTETMKKEQNIYWKFLKKKNQREGYFNITGLQSIMKSLPKNLWIMQKSFLI